MTDSQAAAYMARFRLVDPAGRQTVGQAVQGKSCHVLRTEFGQVVYATTVQGGRLWVSAAAGRAGPTVCPALAAQLEVHARQAGADRIGFQTARRGLVRRAHREGFNVIGKVGDGYIMEKVLSVQL